MGDLDDSELFRPLREDLEPLGAAPAELVQLAKRLGHEEPLFLVVLAEGKAAGLYARLDREHAEAPVYCSAEGYTVSREVIEGAPGFVVAKWPQVLFGTCEGGSRRASPRTSCSGGQGRRFGFAVPFRSVWRAYAGEGRSCRVFELNQNVMRLAGTVRVLAASGQWTHVWAWVQGRALLIAPGRGASPLHSFDITTHTVEYGTGLGFALLPTQGPVVATECLCSSVEDKLLWISTLETLRACFGRAGCQANIEAAETHGSQAKEEQVAEQERRAAAAAAPPPKEISYPSKHLEQLVAAHKEAPKAPPAEDGMTEEERQAHKAARSRMLQAQMAQFSALRR